jgi:mRNA-degrading endonuclease RelE of RelBE toxin-antitoxin system
MWNDRLRFSESVGTDWSALAQHERDAAVAALERIDEDPIAGAPLFEPLRGLWIYRTGHLRVIYRIMPEARFVVVLSIARAAETK